jgi:hypothetical protein
MYEPRQAGKAPCIRQGYDFAGRRGIQAEICRFRDDFFLFLFLILFLSIFEEGEEEEDEEDSAAVGFGDRHALPSPLINRKSPRRNFDLHFRQRAAIALRDGK